ncbi:hypothetical protein QEH59_12940 [Coraliomargarita sp. SDUM461004]|uniref:Glycosyl hydrolases family 39 N-terminal catalytic domain-containing protein n=1 Tax=Thalassobacterium sedimentorum TaxID=3041258 RepID=A0ABU1ANJ2_9BACT|nr:hypothetical protein [Coraliomargarita sp. SDUM461004]MDQ8195336.1 hypothetical protein [Coraliomargarita sp. SDUM461004]
MIHKRYISVICVWAIAVSEVMAADLGLEPSVQTRSDFDAPDAANATITLTEETKSQSIQSNETQVVFDWQTVLKEIPPYVYSMNSPAMLFEERVSRPDWAPLMKYLQPRLLRVHSSAQIQKSWMRTGEETWDYDKIKGSLLAAKLPPETELLINIYRWPNSFDADEDGRLDLDRIDDFADLCADLVRYVNIELGLNVKYWEITNERDFAYWRIPKKGNQPDPVALAELYNRAAVAMRAVDDSIILGGPAACSPVPIEPLLEFARHANENLDFISFHSYASGDNSETDTVIYDKVSVMASDANELIQRLREALGREDFGVHLNEYNINYNWRSEEPRMLTHKGAVFDALLLVALVETPGLTAANAWNDTERVYGKSDGKGNLRPAAHVFHYMNEYFQGNRVASESSQPHAVVPFAVASANGKLSFALINRSGVGQNVSLQSMTELDAAWYSARIDETGLHHTGPVFPFRDEIKMSADSVFFFWQD